MWTPFNFFIGSWTGTGKGQSGLSQVERTYEFVLNNNYLHVKSQSIYPPQDQNPKGEVHQDMGFYSYDKSRKVFVFRQFHVEGFVNQYALDTLAPDGLTISFVTESIENIPPGWQGRETYRVLNSDEFTETFELAGPGKDFEIYSESHLKRINK